MVSIIIPVYQVESYLRRCVDSVLQQTYCDFELILVDDGSPDQCGAVCDEYAAKDQRVRVIHKSNGGLSDARNAGLEMARGEYIAFVDSDDWVEENYLVRLMTGLLESGADICECDMRKTGGEVTSSPVEPGTLAIYDAADALEQLINDGVFRQHVWNKVYRREVIADCWFPKGKTNEDEFWTYQVFGNAKKIAKISDVLYFYFQRPDSIMGIPYSLKRLDALEAKEVRQAYIDEKYPQLSLQAKRNLFGSCIYAGQMTMRYLSGEQRKAAKEKINAIIRQSEISFCVCVRTSGSNGLWFTLARISFWGTCYVKNLLRKGF